MAIGSPALKAGGILLPLIREGPWLLEAQPSRLEEYCCRLSWQDRGYWKPSPQGWKNTVAAYPGRTGAIGSPALKAGRILLPLILAGPGLLEARPSRLEEYCCRLSWQDRGYWKASPKAGGILLPIILAGPGLLEGQP